MHGFSGNWRFHPSAANLPPGLLIEIEPTEPWDGLDGALPEEEPLDAFDDEEVAFGAP